VKQKFRTRENQHLWRRTDLDKIDEVIKYLGAPIGARKNGEMNFVGKNIDNFSR
jgi:hypothetical protein